MPQKVADSNDYYDTHPNLPTFITHLPTLHHQDTLYFPSVTTAIKTIALLGYVVIHNVYLLYRTVSLVT